MTKETTGTVIQYVFEHTSEEHAITEPMGQPEELGEASSPS